MDEGAIDQLFERVFVRAPQLQQFGLADATIYEDELPTFLEVNPRRLISAGRYHGFQKTRFFTPVRREPFIAVVPIQGAIGPGRKSRAVIAALRDFSRDARAKAVVLLVDSPGGSALTSDRIHREVVRLRETKAGRCLFWQCRGQWWLLRGGPCEFHRGAADDHHRQHSEWSRRAWWPRNCWRKLGVVSQVVKRTAHADMFSLARDLDDSESAILDGEADAFYESFVDLVASGRGLANDAVRQVARGRVWAGREAHARGLVDELGGLTQALDKARALAGNASLPPRYAELRRTHARPQDPPGQATTRLSRLEDYPARVLRGLNLTHAEWAVAALRGGEHLLAIAWNLPRIR